MATKVNQFMCNFHVYGIINHLGHGEMWSMSSDLCLSSLRGVSLNTKLNCGTM